MKDDNEIRLGVPFMDHNGRRCLSEDIEPVGSPAGVVGMRCRVWLGCDLRQWINHCCARSLMRTHLNDVVSDATLTESGLPHCLLHVAAL